MVNVELLATRTVGETLPISIGTAEAIQALLNSNALGKYRVLLVNLRTLVRNFYDAFKPVMVGEIDPKDAAVAIAEEIQYLRTAVTEKPIVVYLSEYKDVFTVLPGAAPRTWRTERQLVLKSIEEYTLDVLRISGVVDDHYKNVLFDRTIPGSVLILTHCVVDLFNRFNVGTLDLLESHTGKIKDRSVWYTKLVSGKAPATLPFNRLTVAIFGDRGVLLDPQSIHLRNVVVELSQICKWTTITSISKIKTDLLKISDLEAKAALVALARPYV